FGRTKLPQRFALKTLFLKETFVAIMTRSCARIQRNSASPRIGAGSAIDSRLPPLPQYCSNLRFIKLLILGVHWRHSLLQEGLWPSFSACWEFSRLSCSLAALAPM